MSVDLNRDEDQSGAAESAAVQALAAVARLKSAVELRILPSFDVRQRDRFLQSLDAMLSCAMACLKDARTGGMVISVASDPIGRYQPYTRTRVGSADLR